MRAGVSAELDAVIQRALAKKPAERYGDWDEFAQALSGLVRGREGAARRLAGRARLGALHAAAQLEFFAGFGDVELWEVVHRAKWQRFPFGHALYRKGETGNSFHILAQGEVEVFRDGQAGGRSSAQAPRSARWPTWRRALS